MSLFSKPGEWWLSSATDPRWNASGRVDVLVVTAGMTKEAEEALARLKAQYGEPPADLTYGCMKD